MSIKLKNIVFVEPRFNEALNELIGQPIGIRKSYELSKLMDELAKKSEVYQKAHRVLLNKYGKKDKDGNLIETADKNGKKSVTLDPEKRIKLNKEWEELISIEETYDVEKIDIDIDEAEKAGLRLKPTSISILQKDVVNFS